MKKLISIIAAILIITIAVVTVLNIGDNKSESQPAAEASVEAAETVTEPATVEEPAAAETETAETAEAVAAGTLDYDALYNAYAPDEVVAKVNGTDITWSEMYGWVCYYASSVQSTMDSYATYYGYEMTWDDAINEEGDTFASSAIFQSSDYLKQIYSVIDYAKEHGIVVDNMEQKISDAFQEDAVAILGEDASEEALEAYLEDAHMSRKQYETILEFNLLYEAIYETNYGKNAELVSDEDAVKYLEDNGYYYANHILFLTSDIANETGLSEEAVKKAYENAEKIAKELQAIDDKEELVAKFLELKEEFDEDTGKTSYPNGYVFTDGQMVESFQNAVAEAKEYEVTDPVESSYGYHVIIRLPLDPDVVIPNQSKSARQLVADTAHSEVMNENYYNTEVEILSNLSNFNLKDYFA